MKIKPILFCCQKSLCWRWDAQTCINLTLTLAAFIAFCSRVHLHLQDLKWSWQALMPLAFENSFAVGHGDSSACLVT